MSGRNSEAKVRAVLLRAMRQYSWMRDTQARAEASILRAEEQLEVKRKATVAWVDKVQHQAGTVLALSRDSLIELGARPDQADAILKDAAAMADTDPDRVARWIAATVPTVINGGTRP